MQRIQQQLPDAVSQREASLLLWRPGADPPNVSRLSRSAPAYHVDTDKGFLYSSADEAFVCQKKNHFQVTVHIGVATEPRYVRTPRGPQEVNHFLIKVFGIKVTLHTVP